MSQRIVLLVTLEDTGEQTPPLDPPTIDAVRDEIQSNLESVWPYASVSVKNAEVVEKSVDRLDDAATFIREEISESAGQQWTYAAEELRALLVFRDIPEPLCSICRTPGRHNHACE